MPTALIIGAGSRVGLATANVFAEAGYTVATASRSSKVSGPNSNHFIVDASKPEAITGLFRDVKAAVGTPSVVIYNAYGAHVTKPFGTSLDTFISDLHVNATSLWVAAGESVKGFEELERAGHLGAEGGTYIFTGNLLNETVAPGFMSFGMGKAAGANLISSLAQVEYLDKPYKFYYGDERNEDGSPKPTGLNGPAHAKLYLDLAKDSKQRPWQQTFVRDKGYAKFTPSATWIPE